MIKYLDVDRFTNIKRAKRLIFQWCSFFLVCFHYISVKYISSSSILPTHFHLTVMATNSMAVSLNPLFLLIFIPKAVLAEER